MSPNNRAPQVVEALLRAKLEPSYPVIERVIRRVLLSQQEESTTQAIIDDILRYCGRDEKIKATKVRRRGSLRKPVDASS